MSDLLPFLFGALCALFAVPSFLFVRLNRVEGAGSAPPHRDHWWSGARGQYLRNQGAINVVIVFIAAFILLRQDHFAGEEFDTPALLGFSLAQALFWSLILTFPPHLRKDRSELSKRASARVRRYQSTTPRRWLSLGLVLTILGALLLFPGKVSVEWSGRLGGALLMPAHLFLGFLCVSSMIRNELDDGLRWGFLAAFLLPPSIALVLTLTAG